MSGDSYRPMRDRPPPLSGRVTFTSGGGDNYDSYRPGPRHGGNQSEFTFSSGGQGPRFPPTGPRTSNASSSRMRSSGGRGGKAQSQRGLEQYPRDRRRDQKGNGRGGFRPFRKAAPHERALLQNRDNGASPEHTLGITEGVNRFRNLEDLSASESDMDIDDDQLHSGHSSSDGQEGRRKVARVQASSRADGDLVPKWSNPDPYTVLPPPDEGTVKKLDFVQLIRKAKNQAAENGAGKNAVAANDDFISFGDEDEEQISPAIPPPPKSRPPPTPSPPPLPPSPAYPLTGSLNDMAATNTLPNATQGTKRPAGIAGLPDRPQHPGQQPQPQAPKRKRSQFEGGIVADWMPNGRGNPTPWCINGQYAKTISEQSISDRDKMIRLLHNEILDFYDHVQPDPHESSVRRNLMKRIEQAFKNWPAVQDTCLVRCFGSFPAGLYLPTADMDLVLVTNSHNNGGEKLINFEIRRTANKVLYPAAKLLQQRRIAPTTQVVAKAKVPIIKFVDQKTGIKVDLSFENLTGVAAQTTFREWIDTCPDLVVVVALVKQFLAMRGLNDVHIGGLGGFSIICLVYYYLYREEKAKDNLAGVLLGFLDFYGNRFDLARQRLVMTNPPKLVLKGEYGIDGRKEKIDGLSIQDPNNPVNNISGGSHKAKQVFELFSKAHRALEDHVATLDLSGSSILGAILGGNYESYRRHREHIKRVL